MHTVKRSKPWVFAPPPAEASEIVHQDAPPILNSVRAWARLLHVSASRGLRPIAAAPNRRKVGLWNSLVGGGRRYVTLAKWVTEVGHWPPSCLGNFSVIKVAHFCGASCAARLRCELRLRQLHLHKIHKAQITWIGVLVHIPTSWFEHRA